MYYKIRRVYGKRTLPRIIALSSPTAGMPTVNTNASMYWPLSTFSPVACRLASISGKENRARISRRYVYRVEEFGTLGPFFCNCQMWWTFFPERKIG